MKRNAVKKLEVHDDIHHRIKALAFKTNFMMKRLASAIIHEALADPDFLQRLLAKLKEDDRYYERA